MGVLKTPIVNPASSSAKVATLPAKRFIRASSAIKPRIIGASFGEPGTGKTSWWLGAPGPIYVFSLDQGLEGVVEKYQEDKDIYVAEYNWAPFHTTSRDDVEIAADDKRMQNEACDLRDRILADFQLALDGDGKLAPARTILIDKLTDVWELFRYAEFGAPNDAPRNYPKLNQRMRRLLNMPKAYDCNFGVVEGMKDEWKTSAKVKADGSVKESPISTGKRVRQGFGETEGLVHVNIHHTRERNKAGETVFVLNVGKSRGPGAGEVQDGRFESTDFASFGMMLFPDSEDSDWV